jgi:hypothetical protein
MQRTARNIVQYLWYCRLDHRDVLSHQQKLRANSEALGKQAQRQKSLHHESI